MASRTRELVFPITSRVTMTSTWRSPSSYVGWLCLKARRIHIQSRARPQNGLPNLSIPCSYDISFHLRVLHIHKHTWITAKHQLSSSSCHRLFVLNGKSLENELPLDGAWVHPPTLCLSRVDGTAPDVKIICREKTDVYLNSFANVI